MTNKNNNVGYTGQSATDAGAFYAPYIPLQVRDKTSGWRASLQSWANYYSNRASREIAIEEIWQFMQEKYPGPYQVVVTEEYTEEGPVFRTRYGDTPKRNRVELRLQFDTPEDETWWHLKYD